MSQTIEEILRECGFLPRERYDSPLSEKIGAELGVGATDLFAVACRHARLWNLEYGDTLDMLWEVAELHRKQEPIPWPGREGVVKELGESGAICEVYGCDTFMTQTGFVEPITYFKTCAICDKRQSGQKRGGRIRWKDVE